MNINKTVLKIISKAFSLPVGDETSHHVKDIYAYGGKNP